MGCTGSSGAREADEGEQEEMFRYAVKEMWILCASHFLQNGQKLNVKIPPQQTRSISAEVAEVERQQSDTADGGGVVSQMLGRAKHGVEQAVAKGHGARSSLLDGLKQTRDSCIEDVQVDLLEKSNCELLQKFADVIKTRTVTDARGLVRGGHPYGPDEYRKCPPDRISRDLYDNHRLEFKQILRDHCKLDANPSVKAWGQLLDKIGKANELLGRQKFAGNFDIKEHIVDKTLLHMVEQMAEHEATLRRSPADKAKDHPETFEACFSGRALLSTDFAKFKGGGR